MDQATYAIAGWDDRYETSESRKRKGPLSWVALPTQRDDRSQSYVTKHPRACELMAAFTAMLQVAARLDRRGVLADENGPLDADDLATMTNLPAEAFEVAFEVLTEPRIRWLEEVVDVSHNLPESAGVAADGGTSCGGVPVDAGVHEKTGPTETEHETEHEQNKTEQNETEQGSSGSSSNGRNVGNRQGAGGRSADSDSSESRSGASGSDSLKGPIRREAARLKYFGRVEGLFGRNGTGEGSHPRGSPQWESDQTSAMNWFDEVIWPADAGQTSAECRGRLDGMMKLIGQAQRKNKPMAWLTDRVKKEFQGVTI